MGALVKNVFAASLLGAFLLAGCDDSTGSSSNPVAGKWKGTVADSTLTMDFKDTSFAATLPNPFGTYAMSGTYKFTSTTVALYYASSMQGTEGIPPPSTDTVIGTLSGNKLTIPAPYRGSETVTLTKQ